MKGSGVLGRVRRWVFALGLIAVAGVAEAQPPTVTTVEPLVAVAPKRPAEAPVPKTRSWAPNLSVEQTAAMVCWSSLSQIELFRGSLQKRAAFHDATVAARQKRRDQALGFATAEEVETQELARQAAWRALYDQAYARVGDRWTKGSTPFLVVENIQHRAATDRPWPSWLITGQVRNTGRRTIVLPPLGYWVADERGAVVLEGVALHVPETIGPGEAQPIAFRLHNPPEYGVVAGAYFGPPYYGDYYRGCTFHESPGFDPRGLAAEMLAAGADRAARAGEVFDTTAPYSSNELARLENYWHATAMRFAAMQENEPDCGPGFTGHWRDYLALAELADEAFWAVRTAQILARDVESGTVAQASAKNAELLAERALAALAQARSVERSQIRELSLTDAAARIGAPIPRILSKMEMSAAAMLTDRGLAPVPSVTASGVIRNLTNKPASYPGVAVTFHDRRGGLVSMAIVQERRMISPTTPAAFNFHVPLGRPHVPPHSVYPPADLTASVGVDFAPPGCSATQNRRGDVFTP